VRRIFKAGCVAEKNSTSFGTEFCLGVDSIPGLRYSMGMELIFEIRDAEEGVYFARALGHGIFTEAQTWEEPVEAA
jgi:hypothetical protein